MQPLNPYRKSTGTVNCCAGVKPGTHACLLYRSTKERNRTVASWLYGALEHDERAVYITGDADISHTRYWLGEFGIYMPDENLLTASESYYPDGVFEPRKMIQRLKDTVKKTTVKGFTALRGTGEMNWILKEIPGREKLLEYEKKLNRLTAEMPFSALCQYDLNRFDNRTLHPLISVHPWIVLQGQLLHNPWYQKQ